MFRLCLSNLERRLSGINMGRLRLAQQFSNIDGFQARQDERFDEYVSAKRQKERYDSFDQRVERGYAAAARLHKQEVINGFKRKLKESNGKYTASTTLEIRQAVEDRLQWLRDVWTQIDTDYRSNDSARQEVASKEISAALRGEPGDYMRWVYDVKRERRFLGSKGQAELDSQTQDAHLPDVSDDEVNRYHGLKINMLDVEINVKNKYGFAGQQHWVELQNSKDESYMEKLNHAAAMYQVLLDQSSRLEESRRTELLRSNIERTHQAQVRFKAAMELEREREKLVEAHEAMKAERAQYQKEQRKQLLRESAQLKEQGKTSSEISNIVRERQLEMHAQEQAEYQWREQKYILEQKSRYLDMISNLKQGVEEREGEELLQPNLQSFPRYGDTMSGNFPTAFGFADADRLDDPMDSVAPVRADADSSVHYTHDRYQGAPMATSQEMTASKGYPSEKKDLWESISSDKYEEPFQTVHQARLDAARNYDPVYSKTFPMNLVLGKKYTKQGMGELAAGNEMDRHILQRSGRVAQSFQWGVAPSLVHNIDGDGETDYFFDGSFHVRDEKTGDIDWRYEKKSGGAVFRGPRFYRLGAERDQKNPGERTVDPMPGGSPEFRGSASSFKKPNQNKK